METVKAYFARRGIELSDEQAQRITEVSNAYAGIGLTGFVPMLGNVLTSNLSEYFDDRLQAEIRGIATETPRGIFRNTKRRQTKPRKKR